MVRKHHCRCCGGIFCGNCSDKFLWYDKKRVKVVQRKDHDDFEFPPYRTCLPCYENLLEMKLLLSPWGDRLKNSTRDHDHAEIPEINSAPPTASSASSARINEVIKNNQVSENIRDLGSECSSTAAQSKNNQDYERCPICNADLGSLSEDASREHVQHCLEMAEMAQQHNNNVDMVGSLTFQNRMLVYVVPENKNRVDNEGTYPECPICFEEMKGGDKVGRLECLCVFHYNCIKSWFRKKTQKVKAGSIKFAGKNFCPLHDAVF